MSTYSNMLSLVPSATLDLGAASKTRARTTSTRLPAAPNDLQVVDTSNPVARTAVSLEYASLRHNDHCPLGMYVVPSAEDLLVWDSVFFVHRGLFRVMPCALEAHSYWTVNVGYYADSILKFRITFSNDYPEKLPVVQFLTDG